jgi:hypothetical protein
MPNSGLAIHISTTAKPIHQFISITSGYTYFPRQWVTLFADRYLPSEACEIGELQANIARQLSPGSIYGQTNPEFCFPTY